MRDYSETESRLRFMAEKSKALNMLTGWDDGGVTALYTDAADAIEEVVAERDQFREQAKMVPKWIPVTERLPDEDMEVLISYRYKEGEGDTNHVNIDITTYGQMYFGSREVEGVKHWRPPFEYFSSNYEVVAWMPLPEPPKEVEK